MFQKLLLISIIINIEATVHFPHQVFYKKVCYSYFLSNNKDKNNLFL